MFLLYHTDMVFTLWSWLETQSLWSWVSGGCRRQVFCGSGGGGGAAVLFYADSAAREMLEYRLDASCICAFIGPDCKRMQCHLMAPHMQPGL